MAQDHPPLYGSLVDHWCGSLVWIPGVGQDSKHNLAWATQSILKHTIGARTTNSSISALLHELDNHAQNCQRPDHPEYLACLCNCPTRSMTTPCLLPASATAPAAA
eukprot:366461-Chlamydomonas_euryale.AAC.8